MSPGQGSLPVWAVAGMLAVASCGGPPPSPPPVPLEVVGSACPLPLVFAPDEPHPRRVRIVNEMEEEIHVFLDRCFWHSRMADVPPGSWRQARLPGELIAHEGALWFHAFDGERRVATYAVEVRPEPVLRLVLSPTDTAAEDVRPRWDPLPEGAERSAGPTVLASSEQGFVSVWGVAGGGVLTWSCRGDEGPWLSLTLGRKTRGSEPPAVEVELGGEWRDAGRWTVMESVTDALVAPREVDDALTRDLLDAGRARIRVREHRSRNTVFAFETAGVQGRLRDLACWSG